jgi:hypothetical protein
MRPGSTRNNSASKVEPIEYLICPIFWAEKIEMVIRSRRLFMLSCILRRLRLIAAPQNKLEPRCYETIAYWLRAYLVFSTEVSKFWRSAIASNGFYIPFSLFRLVLAQIMTSYTDQIWNNLEHAKNGKSPSFSLFEAQNVAALRGMKPARWRRRSWRSRVGQDRQGSRTAHLLLLQHLENSMRRQDRACGPGN